LCLTFCRPKGRAISRRSRIGVLADQLIRAILRRPDDITNFGDARIWSETTRLDLRLSEVLNPRPGDRIEIDGDAFLIQGEPVRDRERLIWTVDLRPA
jgi:hypothetical protein